MRENSRELTDDDLAITRESTEEDVTSTDHYVTSVQTISESVNDESVLSASELVSEFDFSSNQVIVCEGSRDTKFSIYDSGHKRRVQYYQRHTN